MAIQKYGKENFEVQILEECKREELNDKERYYIEKYNSFSKFGYNLNAGGNSSPDDFTLTRRENISKACKGRTSPNKGKPMSEEQKLKISETLKRRYANSEIKPAWNKGLTKETDERVLKYATNSRHKKSVIPKRRPRTDEEKQKIRDGVLRYIKEKEGKNEN